jgi:hypothetical protein
MNLSLSLFTDWQCYRGGRAFRQLLLEPSYTRKHQYSIELKQITQSHLLIILTDFISHNRYLLVLDRLVNNDDNTTATLDTSIDYLENICVSLEQWMESSGVFQIKLNYDAEVNVNTDPTDERKKRRGSIPILMEILPIDGNDFLWIISTKGVFLLWKYDDNVLNWMFYGKFSLFSNSASLSFSSSTISISHCCYHESSKRLLWIEESEDSTVFEKDSFELEIHHPHYRIRMCSLIFPSISSSLETFSTSSLSSVSSAPIIFNLTPPLTIFCAESYLSHCLLSHSFCFLTKELRFFTYSFDSSKMNSFSFDKFLVKNRNTLNEDEINVLGEEVSSPFLTTIIPILNVLPSYKTLKRSKNQQEPDAFINSDDYLALMLSRQPVNNNYQCHEFLYIFKIVENGNFHLLRRAELPISLRKSSSNSFSILSVNDDCCYLSHVSYPQNKLLIHQVYLRSTSSTGRTNETSDFSPSLDDESFPFISVDFPFKYLHGRSIQSHFLDETFIFRRKYHSSHNLPTFTSSSDANISNTPLKRVNGIFTTPEQQQTSNKIVFCLPLLWGDSGVFQLNSLVEFSKENQHLNGRLLLTQVRYEFLVSCLI